MSCIKLWKALRKGESRGLREVLGDRPLMLAAVFSVALHAAFFHFLGDWPHFARPPGRVPAVMVARLLKPAAEAPVAVPEEIAGEEEGSGTEEERLLETGSDALPDREAGDSGPSGYDDASASLTAQSGADLAVAEGRLRLNAVAVVRAKPVTAAANRVSRRNMAGILDISVSTSAARRDRDIRSALLEIRERIESRKIYPLMARRRGWEGEVLVEIVLGGAGELEGLRLLRQSGFPLLDRATLTAVRAAVPFPPVPGRVKIPVSYRLVPD
jgi:TonB family protein